jgi:hypothetical protein
MNKPEPIRLASTQQVLPLRLREEGSHGYKEPSAPEMPPPAAAQDAKPRLLRTLPGM